MKNFTIFPRFGSGQKKSIMPSEIAYFNNCSSGVVIFYPGKILRQFDRDKGNLRQNLHFWINY